MKFENNCITCRYCYLGNDSLWCKLCDNYNSWIPPYWLEEWLNSFDTSSATKCFEAVNILKQRLEDEH